MYGKQTLSSNAMRSINKQQTNDRLNLDKSMNHDVSFLTASHVEDPSDSNNESPIKTQPKRKSILKNRVEGNTRQNKIGFDRSLINSPLVGHYESRTPNQRFVELGKKESPIKINHTIYDQTSNDKNNEQNPNNISINTYNIETPYIKLPPIQIKITHQQTQNNYTIINSNDPNSIITDKDSSETDQDFKRNIIRKISGKTIQEQVSDGSNKKLKKKVGFIMETNNMNKSVIILLLFLDGFR